MKSILLQMYQEYKDRDDRAQMATKELMQLQNMEVCAEEKLYNKLKAIDPRLMRELEEVLNNAYRINTFEMPEVFVDGFKLGAKLMIEIYQNDYSHKEED